MSAVLAAAALWSHVTADENATYGEDARQYTVDVTRGCLPPSRVAARVRQGIMPTFFVQGLLCLARVMSGVFDTLVCSGQVFVAAMGVIAAVAYSARHYRVCAWHLTKDGDVHVGTFGGPGVYIPMP